MMEKLLKRYFGHKQFRPFQEEVIINVLKKKDSFIILPTGGGKSLCYQFPALEFKGLTLVISPLISLMKDQVDALKSNGIRAEYINSSLSSKEIFQIQKKLSEGKIKILYAAPERLSLETFRSFLQGLKIDLIAVDEAHCISEWGHDFRPDYRNLKFLKKQFSGVPIIALTATATPEVRKDIIKQLSLDKPKICISSFDRKNLSFFVLRKSGSQTFYKLLELLKEHRNESAIVYCFSRKDTEDIANDLNIEGFNALPYHAGLNKEIRKHNQEMFIQDKASIMVATIAFGMGIDKPNVRLVVHYTFPKTLEEYYQQIGRAGRDGLPSKCVLFYSYGDKMKHEYFLEQISSPDERNHIQGKINQIVEYCETIDCRRKFLLGYFGEEFSEENCGACDICLQRG